MATILPLPTPEEEEASATRGRDTNRREERHAARCPARLDVLLYRDGDPATCIAACASRDIGDGTLFLALDPVQLGLAPGMRLQLCLRAQRVPHGAHRRLLRARVARWAEDGVAVALTEDDLEVRELLEERVERHRARTWARATRAGRAAAAPGECTGTG